MTHVHHHVELHWAFVRQTKNLWARLFYFLYCSFLLVLFADAVICPPRTLLNALWTRVHTTGRYPSSFHENNEVGSSRGQNRRITFWFAPIYLFIHFFKLNIHDMRIYTAGKYLIIFFLFIIFRILINYLFLLQFSFFNT